MKTTKYIKDTYFTRADIMSRAWSIYKNTSYDNFIKNSRRRFASCLERAYWIAKEDKKHVDAKQAEIEHKKWYEENKGLIREVISKSMGDPSEYYKGNRYNGD